MVDTRSLNPIADGELLLAVQSAIGLVNRDLQSLPVAFNLNDNYDSLWLESRGLLPPNASYSVVTPLQFLKSPDVLPKFGAVAYESYTASLGGVYENVYYLPAVITMAGVKSGIAMSSALLASGQFPDTKIIFDTRGYVSAVSDCSALLLF